MSKGLIVYFSQGGTTASVAERIVTGLTTAGYATDLCNLKDEKPPTLSGYTLLGIGAPVYYYRPPFNVMDYTKSLPDLDGLPFFVFVLYGTYRGDAGTYLRQALTHKKGQEVGYFHCYGADYFLGYLQEGYLFSPDHPTAQELAQAETFGCEVAAHCEGKQYVKPEDDNPPPIVNRLERFFVNQWLVNKVYSRLFKVDARTCTSCGLCTELCPQKNITEDPNGHPVWGRQCLLCLTCQMKCPEEAIVSPVSWARRSLFRVALRYNVRQALQDPSLEHVRVIHSNGLTNRVEK